MIEGYSSTTWLVSSETSYLSNVKDLQGARASSDGFPCFRDGDVEIRFTRKPEDAISVHSAVLKSNSP